MDAETARRRAGGTRERGSVVLALAATAAFFFAHPATAAALPQITATTTDAVASLPWDVQSRRPMREATTVHVSSDGSTLFVRFDARQREPIVQTQKTNDVGQGTDDEVWVDLWPSGPTGFQYQFFATPNGTHYETSSENTSFAPHWQSSGSVQDGGYTVDMKIPLTVMRGAQEGHAWNVQFVRYIRTTGEQAVWSYDSGQTNADDPARAGLLQIQAAVVKRLKPRLSTYVLSAAAPATIGGSTSRVGADISVPVTPTISLYGTFHPDFSNVELDQQTISPTVFPRSYAEVRPFFTQGAANFTNFYCNFCNGASYSLTPFYTPAIPTPASGYAIEGKSGAWSFTALDTSALRRSDQATGVVYTSPDTRWNGAFTRVAVDTPGLKDDESVGGLYYQDLKHLTVYANYGNDSGTDVLVGNRAQFYDTGATWNSQTFSIWTGIHRSGEYFNPVDAFVLLPGVNGWGLFSNKIWTFSPASHINAVEVGGMVQRDHADWGPLNQTVNKVDVDVLTRNAIDVNLTSGSSYVLLNDTLTPISQNGVAVTYLSGVQTNHPSSFDNHGPSANPTVVSYNTGRFGGGRLDTWLRSAAIRVGTRGTLTLELDDTAQRFTRGSANIQWFDRAAYSYQLSSESSLGIGLRRVIGSPPVPNGGGNCVARCSNVTLAYHLRLQHAELYCAYGDPNALSTLPQLLVKAIFYAGADKGT